jgi:hypothetical protein
MKIPRDAEEFEYETPSGENRLALVTYADDEDAYGESFTYIEIWQITAYDEAGEPYIVALTDQEEQWADDAYNPPKAPTRREWLTACRAELQGVDL